MGRLEGQVALVTGAGSGIGRATACLFATEGAQVVVADLDEALARQTVKTIRARNGTGMAVRTDVAVSTDVQAAVAAAVDAYGRLDVLVNNAGYALQGPVTAIAEDDWNRIMAVNVKGVWLGCKHAIPHMLRQGKGAIVNTASRVGLRGIPNMSAYSTTKGAVVLMTYALALELAERNIRVNCVCPGPVDTPALERFWPQFPDPEAVRRSFVEAVPMKRMSSPEEIARAILFLASDRSSYMTGVAMSVDGGRIAV
jgi:meso-butanediol dehydrogenase/(S,S)-butanediol dehydrogenase/diacetyl reductase